MKGVPPVIERALAALGQLPGIGPRSADRIVYHLLRADPEAVRVLADALRDLKEKVVRCSDCRNVAEQDPCPICRDPGRDPETICVVEQPKDVIAFEETGVHRGRYYVLLGRVAPLEGQEAEDLDLAGLVKQARSGPVKEVIIATNPTLEGDATGLFLARALKDCPVKVTRIARGIPSGGAIEYANKAILADALAGRRPLAES